MSIADIIAMKAKVMIFDEPMAALDHINADSVEKILNRLHNDGTTLIVATHDTDFAYRFADRIIVFLDGEVVADGDPEDLFSDGRMLQSAHLRRPMLLEISSLLKKHGFLNQHEIAPKNMEQMRTVIKNLKGECKDE